KTERSGLWRGRKSTCLAGLFERAAARRRDVAGLGIPAPCRAGGRAQARPVARSVEPVGRRARDWYVVAVLCRPVFRFGLPADLRVYRSLSSGQRRGGQI